MRNALSQASIGLVAGAIYGLLRAVSTSKPGESIASGLLLAVFVFIVLHRKTVLSFRLVGRPFVPARSALLSAAVALFVVGMGVLRHGVLLHVAVLDAALAFLFFLALGSFFGQKGHAENNDPAA